MKKVKNLVLLTAFGICSLFLFGVGKVSAISGPSIVCTPSAVENNQKTTCILYANFTDDPKSYYAMLLHVGLQDLEYVSSNGKDSVTPGWGNTVSKEFFKNTGDSNTFTHLKDSKGPVACTATKITNDGYKESCALIYSTSESKPAIKNNQDSGSKLTVIAKFELVLKQKEVKKCGKICVMGQAFPENNVDGQLFSELTNCKEVEVQGQNNPEPVPTGNFTSYIILAAGAFIALCAVLVAKKNNRFYRV